MSSRIEISASIMCADLLNLNKDLKILKKCNIEYLHLDIMDGHFVDNLTLGIDCCVALKKIGIPRDIHLLVSKPSKFIEKIELQEGDIFQCHFEANDNFKMIAQQVHSYKARFGIVLNPETKIESIEPYLTYIDMVNLMMIRPGFAGQPLEDGMIEKIKYSKNWIDKHSKHEIVIEVDGHVNDEYAFHMYNNGARMFVAGSSSIFRKDISIEEGIKRLRETVTADMGEI